MIGTFLALTTVNVWGASQEGVISKLVVLQSGDIEVTIGSTAGKKIRAANDNIKPMYAMLLTAQSTGKTVKITHDSGIVKTVALFTEAP